jgi:predicted DsbA family dithiol-disulfide isomerase
MPDAVTIKHFTDPACPFAFSAEPRLRRLEWLYGDGLRWETVMVVLSETTEEYEAKGFTPEKLAGGMRSLQQAHGMPIDWRPRARLAVSVDACRDVKAAQLRAPDRAEALLRHLRVLTMDGGLLDDPAMRAEAARLAAIDPGALEADAEVEAALQEDKRASRTPSSAARALDHKLGGPAGERRYTCPSLELDAVALPGFQPMEAYEAAVANVAPDLPRRADPGDVGEVLAWAPFPLATAEVAAVRDAGIEETRVELAGSGAAFSPAGADGYWSPA